MDWSRYNTAIITRHGIKDLYKNCSKFLEDIPYKKYPLINTSAAGYLESVIRAKYDWVINIDDDAFLINPKHLYNLMVYMDENNYDYCGMADGGFDGCRYTGNPCSMNPFFNVFNLKSIREKIDVHIPKFIGIKFEDSLKDLVNYTGFKLPKERCRYEPDQEPYYYFFFRLLRDTKPLFLQAKLYDDNLTTMLYNHNNELLVYHTWYGRLYNQDEMHKKRINQVIKLVDDYHNKSHGRLMPPNI